MSHHNPTLYVQICLRKPLRKQKIAKNSVFGLKRPTILRKQCGLRACSPEHLKQ